MYNLYVNKSLHAPITEFRIYKRNFLDKAGVQFEISLKVIGSEVISAEISLQFSFMKHLVTCLWCLALKKFPMINLEK